MKGYSVNLSTEYTRARQKFRATDKAYLGLLRKIGIAGRNILDFGCGDGIHSFLLAPLNPHKMVGIDNSSRMISLAKQCLHEQPFSNLMFKKIDGEDMSFRAKSFDIVISNYVLQHFKDLTKTLREIHRVLKQGGELVFTTNTFRVKNIRILRKNADLRLGGTNGVLVHDRIFTTQDFLDALIKVGFSIQSVKSLKNDKVSIVKNEIGMQISRIEHILVHVTKR